MIKNSKRYMLLVTALYLFSVSAFADEYWTQWYDNNVPIANYGEVEPYPVDPLTICNGSTATAVDCREKITGSPMWSSSEELLCDVRKGLRCIDQAQEDGVCNDYKVRFLCGDNDPNPTPLTANLSCTDYNVEFGCSASASGGTSGYTYEFSWVPISAVNNCQLAGDRTLSCICSVSGQVTVSVEVTDSEGETDSDYTIANCLYLGEGVPKLQIPRK